MQPVSLAGFSYLAGATRLPGRPGRSNMSKLGSDGKPLLRDDGKVLKSDRYFPPGIASVLGLEDH